MGSSKSHRSALRPSLLKLLCGTGNLGDIWSAFGEHEIQCTE